MLTPITAPFIPTSRRSLSKPRTTEAYVQQKVSLPATLMARFTLLHWDPVHSKARYGAISDVLTKLLVSYVAQMEQGVDPLSAQGPSEPDITKL